MKRIICVLAILFSVNLYAGEVSSMRTPNGDLVRIGDSESVLVQKMGHTHHHEYILRIDGRAYSAKDYTYQVENVIYVVTIANGAIHKIDWRYR